MRFAFKEWAVVVDALGSGRQIIILRKGGISEGRRGFQVERAEFLLYPTLVHQQKDSVLPEAQERFDSLASSQADPTVVRLEFFAHVVSWKRLDTLAAAEKLRGQHIWRDQVIAQRFEWGKEKNIYVLAVRVFQLAQPIGLPVLPTYAGCKSWVDLENEFETTDATPVLSKEVFNEKLNRFHAALDEPAVTPGNDSPS